jgi:ureidoglycolate hydrolase
MSGGEMKVKLESVTAEKFAPFGDVLEFPPEAVENFRIVVKEDSASWRLAVLRFTRHTVERLENHPASRESFEPLKGATVLLVAEHNNPAEFTAFFLDKPVCLYKGIWHDVLALTPEAQIKITENLDVNSEYYNLKEPVAVFIG